MKTRSACDRKAFTLIELLIAVSIFAVVSVALHSAFFAGVSIWRRSGEGGDMNQEIKYALDDLAKDLKNAVYMTEDEESAYAFSGSSEEVSFISLEGAFSEEAGSTLREMARVKYVYDGKEGELIRAKAGKPLGFNMENAEKEVVLSGIEELKFSYCYASQEEFEPYEWEEEWEAEDSRIPRGVRLTMRIKRDGRGDPLELTKTIFIPTGILGEKEVGL